MESWQKTQNGYLGDLFHAPAGVIPEWQQPAGAHDAYNTGDMVTYQGQVYRSLIDANVWSPAEYATGWSAQEE